MPDALAWADADALTVDPSDMRPFSPVETIAYPKFDGSVIMAPVLQVADIVQLHRAVEFLRDDADATLGPGVCGYRRGAEDGFSYSRENIRFHEMIAAETENAQYVVLADIQEFFWHSDWDLVLRRAVDLTSHEAAAPLRRFAQAASAAGIHCLPAGYADARLLGNVVLRAVDDVVTAPMVRWVDDYRIFCASEEEAASQLQALRGALAADGLRLNERKTAAVQAGSFAWGLGDSLQSVYHPDVERPEQVRASLRTVFFRAAQEPIRDRRALRFVLPRLAEQGDDCAVEWALSALPQIPWEAPRICAYLGAFADCSEVAARVEEIFLRAAMDGDTWMACRTAALASHTGVSTRGGTLLADVLRTTDSRSLWALGVRALAVSGHRGRVDAVLDSGVRDVRAAAAALVDIDRAHEAATLSGLPAATREVLSAGPVPIPEVDAIL